MYLSHFGLKHAPLAKNSSELWMNDTLLRFNEQFQSLLQTPAIGLLTGEPGVGKTAVLRHLTQALNPHRYQVFYLAETQFTSFDIYRQFAHQLGLIPAHRFAQLWRDIKNNIKERVEHRRCQPVLIIDEAHNLPMDFLSAFPSFLNFNFDANDFLTVWFVGHTQLATLLDRHIHAALASRIQVRTHLAPITEREPFKQLIDHAFKTAGVQSTLLSDSGFELLRQASQGKPRYAHRILVGALQAAAASGLNHLPDDVITQAINQLKG